MTSIPPPSDPCRVLLVDDDRETCELLEAGLSGRGFNVEWKNDESAAAGALASSSFDVIVADLKLGRAEGGGLSLCRHIVSNHPELPVIILTGFGSMDTAVEAMRAQAVDYLTKPVNLDELASAIEKARLERHTRESIRHLRQVVITSAATDELLGESSSVDQLRQLIERVGPTRSPVLLTGESGTGKELVARALHQSSPRRDEPFVAVNCAAIPGNLLESELFGHAKGAFTGASAERKGLFLHATGGTMFLDELAEMPIDLQPKLLRALEERTVRPVGSNRSVPFDARIIAATNRDLEARVADQSFREDLYYRINVVNIQLPPLRDRGEDVLLLAQHFLRRASTRAGKAVVGISEAAIARLLDYDWPGNIRELENAVERSVILTQLDHITVGDLPERIREHRSHASNVSGSVHKRVVTLAELERRYIDQVLERTAGNRSQTARLLGVDRRTLHRKLARYREEGSEN